MRALDHRTQATVPTFSRGPGAGGRGLAIASLRLLFLQLVESQQWSSGVPSKRHRLRFLFLMDSICIAVQAKRVKCAIKHSSGASTTANSGSAEHDTVSTLNSQTSKIDLSDQMRMFRMATQRMFER